jgi:hypothetical protein
MNKLNRYKLSLLCRAHHYVCSYGWWIKRDNALGVRNLLSKKSNENYKKDRAIDLNKWAMKANKKLWH